MSARPLATALSGLLATAIAVDVGRFVLTPILVLERLAAAGATRLSAVHFAGVGLSATPWAVLLGAALHGGTFMGMTALGLIQARALASRDLKCSLTMTTASFGSGQMVGPAFVGFLHGIADSFVLPSMTAAAALVLAAVLANRARPLTQDAVAHICRLRVRLAGRRNSS